MHSQVSSDMKMAKATPQHKIGSRTEVKNYYPVSTLSKISKTLERVVYSQLYESIQNNNLLSEFQTCFRKSGSTALCLIYLDNLIKEEIYQGNCCAMALLDLQKVLDSANH